MNDEQIKYLLTFLNNTSFVVMFCCAGEWLRFSGGTRLTKGELPEYCAFTTQGFGKYVDLYNVDIDDLCITQVVDLSVKSTLLSLGN